MVMALLADAVATGVTGWLYTTDRFWGMAWLEELHGVLGHLLLPLLALHVAGVVFTPLRQRENRVAAMLHGRKHDRPDGAGKHGRAGQVSGVILEAITPAPANRPPTRPMANPDIPPTGKLHTPMVPPWSDAFGRYTLRRLVFESPRARIWHANDTKSAREVRLKVIKPGQDVDSAAMTRWVHEANHASHIAHVAIVPLLEAGVQDGQPFLASDWVAGQTLADLSRGTAPVPARKAAAWMIELLDALVLAHAAGLVHGRLQPGNILIDTQNRARLLDFALPTRVAEAQALAAHLRQMATWWPLSYNPSGPTRADSDVHAAGMVLARLLSGVVRPDTEGGVDAETHVLDLAMGPDADDTLRAIVHAAVATDPAQRHASAHVFRAQLVRWSGFTVPAAPAMAKAASVKDDGALERLLRRMQENEDFPAMTHAVSRIQAMAASENESVGAVADEILKDVALSNKLLRIVNSAYYARGGGGISTISRAVTLIGFNGLRNMAMGLVLLEGMQDKAHADVLTGEFLRALMAASIARELTATNRDGEETFIGAMFQDLGRLLAMYYFPQEATQVQALMRAGAGKLTEDNASVRVLGLSYEGLGMGVAKLWDLPADIRRYMHKPVGDPPQRPAADVQEQLRWTALAANRLADTLLLEDPAQRAEQLDKVRKRFARALATTPPDMQLAMEVARVKVVDLAAVMELPTVPGSTMARLLQALDTSAQGADGAVPPASGTVAMPALDDAFGSNLSLDDKLAAALTDIDKALAQGQPLKDVLHMVLATLHRAVGLSHAVFCMRDPKTDTLTGRFGVGAGVDAIVQAFRVPLGTVANDLLQAVCARGTDTWIADTATSRLANRLPAWFRQQVPASALLLLPMRLNDKPFALFYAGMVDQKSTTLTERQLGGLRLLRDRAQQALRQAR